MDRKRVISRAQRLIRAGWVKGQSAQWSGERGGFLASSLSGEGRLVAVCGRGGLDRAIWVEKGKPAHTTTRRQDSGTKELHRLLDEEALAYAVDTMGGRKLGTRNVELPGGYLASGLVDLNDYKGTEKKDVLNVFARAKKRVVLDGD